MKKFYDTCSLLDLQEKAFEEDFYISIITLRELENIKTSANKDAETKYKARKLSKLLQKYADKYEVILDQTNDIITADDRIISAAQSVDCQFVTKDMCCWNLAKAKHLNMDFVIDNTIDNYTGFKEIFIPTEENLAYFYEHMNENIFDLLQNEYLIIKTAEDGKIGPYIWTGTEYQEIGYPNFYSEQFGKIKPKDEYQLAAMDCLSRNQISMVRGGAGTGKSFLSLAYLFHLLEEGKIDKIIVFCNTIATIGSAKLGYYPGSKDEKLLDSQIGNILTSKLGDSFAVEQMIESGKLLLLPFSDLRGFDTTGMRAGVYITEAQNLDINLMKLALQRIGDDCICILDGDSDTQVDDSNYAGINNGMRRTSEIFRGHDIYGEVTLQRVYRSKIAEIAEKM